MRIIGGKYKGRKLKEFSFSGTRPTSDMARESLFDIINQDIAGKNFLDLFSGTGAVAIEALSRGAKRAVLVDNKKESISLIKSNLFFVTEDYSVIFKDFESYLLDTSEKFDYIYLDPPYKDGLMESAIAKSVKALSDGGIIITEQENPFNVKLPQGFIAYKEKKYGRAYLTFIKKV